MSDVTPNLMPRISGARADRVSRIYGAAMADVLTIFDSLTPEHEPRTAAILTQTIIMATPEEY